jgi:molybdate transport system ATP-binding protein
MLEIKLKKCFYQKRKLEFELDVNCSLNDGITVLMGHSGSGKTSILRMIAGIIEPDEGFLKVGTQTFFDSAQKINLPIQARNVGFVFQDYSLFPHLNAKQNIAYGIKDAQQQTQQVEELLSLFGIEYAKKRLPNEMSGGEQQRVALARALASSPRILLLDEPLSAIDMKTRTKLLEEIKKAHQQTKIPFLYVTHNEFEAEQLADNRIMLDKGRIAE